MINLVSLTSISFTGTTWMNLVISNHAKAVYLGPPDRSWTLSPKDRLHACLLHRSGSCGFWNRFYENFDANERFLPQFSEYTSGRTIVIANPTKKFMDEEIQKDDVNLSQIFVVRDGRAIIDSFLHHVPDRFDSVEAVARDWLMPASRIMINRCNTGANTLMVRYEDMANDPVGKLTEIGRFIDLDYSAGSLKYWEQEAHPTAGNIGTIDIISRYQGLGAINHSKAKQYKARYKSLKKDPLAIEVDESWRKKFSSNDLTKYKEVMGDIHLELGYDYD